MNIGKLETITEKKKILVVGLVLTLVLGAAATFVASKRQKGEIVSPVSQKGQEGLEGKMVLWDDEAGFTFEYPEGFHLDDHPEDMENYAHLEITSPREPEGKIVILVNDAPTETIDEWLEEDEEATEASIVDTILADAAAKKLLFEDPKKILTAAIDPYEALFLLELTPGEGDFWPQVYDQIVSSFAFKPLTEEEQAILDQAGGGGGGGNVVYEAEEVIE